MNIGNKPEDLHEGETIGIYFIFRNLIPPLHSLKNWEPTKGQEQRPQEALLSAATGGHENAMTLPKANLQKENPVLWGNAVLAFLLFVDGCSAQSLHVALGLVVTTLNFMLSG